MFVDENGVTRRGWIDSEDLKLWGPDARVQLAVGNAKVNIERHTEGRGETSRAMLDDLSMSGLTDMVDTIGGWLGVDGSMHAGEPPAGCEGAHGSPGYRPRYIVNQMDRGVLFFCSPSLGRGLTSFPDVCGLVATRKVLPDNTRLAEKHHWCFLGVRHCECRSCVRICLSIGTVFSFSFFVLRGTQRTSTVVQPLVPSYWPRYQ